MRSQLIISILLLGLSSTAQKSPFNQREFVPDSTGNYSFIVSGHFHGDGNNKSHLPVNTLLANLAWINESNADFMICLGDLFLNIEADMPGYQEYFFDRLEMPLFNSVGNHDLEDEIYQDNFGRTWFAMHLGDDYHMILDTEIDDGDIGEEQLRMFRMAKEGASTGVYQRIFIYSHRTIWKDQYSELDELFTENTQSLTATNFSDDIYPMIESASEHVPVCWFSGSMGGGPSSFFHFQDNNITYILSAIRGLPRDAILLVHVVDGQLSFETKSLTGQKVDAIESYNVDYWKNTEEETDLNLGLMWYRFKVMLRHRYFWYGMGFAIMLSVLFWLIRKRRKKK
jgi:hypothetical protein